MKKLFFLITLVIIGSFTAEAQNSTDVSYSADKITKSDDYNILTMEGRVHFIDNDINFKADRLIFDEKLGKIIAYKVKNFSIDGKIVLNYSKEEEKLEYTIGSKIAQIYNN